MRFDLRRLVRSLRTEGAAAGLDDEQLHATVGLARRAYRSAIVVAHFEDLRALLATWRWLHRWVAALMVLLLVVHVVYALVYGDYFGGAA